MYQQDMAKTDEEGPKLPCVTQEKKIRMMFFETYISVFS